MATNNCRYCGGQGATKLGFGKTVACTSCNGTGIEGDPRFLIGLYFLSTIATIALLYYLFHR